MYFGEKASSQEKHCYRWQLTSVNQVNSHPCFAPLLGEEGDRKLFLAIMEWIPAFLLCISRDFHSPLLLVVLQLAVVFPSQRGIQSLALFNWSYSLGSVLQEKSDNALCRNQIWNWIYAFSLSQAGVMCQDWDGKKKKGKYLTSFKLIRFVRRMLQQQQPKRWCHK